MLVDDDATVRKGLSRLIRSAGYSVRTFASPTEFLKQELPPGPSCALLDLCMDGLSGLEVQDALQRNPRALPVVSFPVTAQFPRPQRG